MNRKERESKKLKDLLRQAAKKTPHERFQSWIEKGLIDEDGKYVGPAKIRSKAK